MKAVARKVTDVVEKNQERSGRKKRKQEVESWFKEVEQLEEEFHLLKEVATRGKKNRGVLKKLNGIVPELEQIGEFGGLLCDVYESEERPMKVQPVHEEMSKQNLEVVWTWLQDENVSSIGIYDMGEQGHSIKDCHALKREIEKMIQDKLIMVQNIDSEENFSHADMQTSG
ncbi:hypothetical protein T459_22705 [Capsicum annuum]|uniref:Uncharacterized protein n=1 Tax=Capsicum annuum TaxID=4072 RepID=A0A2G2YQ99_CAPAN|nr:hypothetical protein T459_22705 [Capsicum annuum]